MRVLSTLGALDVVSLARRPVRSDRDEQLAGRGGVAWGPGACDWRAIAGGHPRVTAASVGQPPDMQKAPGSGA